MIKCSSVASCAVVELLRVPGWHGMKKTVPSATSARCVRSMYSLRVLSVFSRVVVRIRGCGLRVGPSPGGWVTDRSRLWWTASLETRCLGHRLTVLVALGCAMAHARVALG